MEWTGDIRVSGFVGLFFLDSFGEIMDGVDKIFSFKN